jgi:hypothetical protein
MKIHNDKSIQHCRCIRVIRGGRDCAPDTARSAPSSARLRAVRENGIVKTMKITEMRWTLISGMLKRSMKSVKLHAKTRRLLGAKNEG